MLMDNIELLEKFKMNVAVNKFKKETAIKEIIVDCDKRGKEEHQIKKNLCALLNKSIKNCSSFSESLDFYQANKEIIDDLNNNSIDNFFNLITRLNRNGNTSSNHFDLANLKNFINSNLTIKEAFYLMSTEQTPVFFAAPKYPAMLSKLAKGRTESFGDSARGLTWQSHGRRFPAALQ